MFLSCHLLSSRRQFRLSSTHVLCCTIKPPRGALLFVRHWSGQTIEMSFADQNRQNGVSEKSSRDEWNEHEHRGRGTSAKFHAFVKYVFYKSAWTLPKSRSCEWAQMVLVLFFNANLWDSWPRPLSLWWLGQCHEHLNLWGIILDMHSQLVYNFSDRHRKISRTPAIWKLPARSWLQNSK